MFAWAGRIKAYRMVSGYHTLGGYSTWFDIDGVEEFASGGSKEADITVRFADLEVGPGATFGSVSSGSGNVEIEIELPKDWLQTFWRAIDEIQNQNGLLAITTDDNNVINNVGVVLWKGSGRSEEHTRRERLDSLRRRFEAASGS